jgi:parallel beta-helix repeat protein
MNVHGKLRDSIGRPSLLAAVMTAAWLIGSASAGSLVGLTASPQSVPACGDVITADTVLSDDVGPCSDGGLVVAADGVTLDLDGHTVFGTADAGDGVGVTLDGVSGAGVMNGTITGFDAGIFVQGGGANELARLHVLRNGWTPGVARPASGQSFGDGIVLNSDRNLLHHNLVAGNGPNDGIGIFANSGWNTIRDNTVRGNDIGHGTSRFDDGIRLESGAHDNLVAHNLVERNGRSGIATYAYGTGNVVRSNIVRANGAARTDGEPGGGGGHGIAVRDGASPTEVRGNRVFDNVGDGIRVEGRANLIIGNRTGGNGAGGAGFDLHDTNRRPRCDGNTWRENSFETAFPKCTRGMSMPGQPAGGSSRRSPESRYSPDRATIRPSFTAPHNSA